MLHHNVTSGAHTPSVGQLSHGVMGLWGHEVTVVREVSVRFPARLLFLVSFRPEKVHTNRCGEQTNTQNCLDTSTCIELLLTVSEHDYFKAGEGVPAEWSCVGNYFVWQQLIAF